MKYYIDTEFLEGPQDKRFMGFKYGQTPPTIDLISIGIVAEDGKEYYAISKDFNLYEAWNRWQPRTGQGDRNNAEPKEYWIRANVLRPIFDHLWRENCHMANLHHATGDFTYRNMEILIRAYGKPNKEIAIDVVNFVYPACLYNHQNCDPKHIGDPHADSPEFYAYYADYDWVAFCWLFGRMIDLPKGFPMYCRDLKQMLDEMYMFQSKKYEDMSRLQAWLYDCKKHPLFPKQENEHHALADALWAKKLHEFIIHVKSNDFILPIQEEMTAKNPNP